MRYTKAQKKHAWFSYGIEALARIKPDMPKVYCCPLCLRGFYNIDHLTFEDVPPKSIGGKPLVLTCKKCNNTSGSQLDAHIKLGQDLREIYAGKKEAMIDISYEGYKIAASATFNKTGIEIGGLPSHSNPQEHKSFFKRLDFAVENKLKPNFKITHSTNHIKWREQIGWLRIAYLYTFAALGYNYIFFPALDIVREQIQKPDKQILPQAIFYSPKTEHKKIIFLAQKPNNIRGIIVQIDEHIIYFPSYDMDTEKYYERLSEIMKQETFPTISGKSMDVPKKPIFYFDYNPRLMQLILPQNENFCSDSL